MTFEFTPSFRQAYSASLWVATHNPLALPAFLIFPAMGIVFLYTSLISSRGALRPTHVALAVACFAFGPGITAFNLWLSRRRNPTVRGVHRYTFDTDGFTLTGPHFSSRLAWSAVLKIRHSRHFFFLYVSPQFAFFLPRNVVDATGDAQSFLDLLREKAGSNARLPNRAA